MYNKYILPKIIDWACKTKPNMKQREKVIPLAEGDVLEIGIGSGLNVPYYDAAKVNRLTAIDPFPEMWKENKIDINSLEFEFEFIEAFAENIPVDSRSYDTIVITYTLCSIQEVSIALKEARRVLKPGGKLVFCEHGRAPDPSVRRWQNAINPVWKRFGGGCNLTRDIPTILTENDFEIITLETMYIPGWKPACYNFWGYAN